MELLSRLIIFITILKLFISDIIIKSPKELKEKFNHKPIKVSLSNFGRIPYGYNLIGKLYYDPDNTDVDMACKEITTIEIGENHPIDESPIVMVDRGNCTFVTKVRNVEKLGGHVALIVNNNEDDVEYIIMSDDGRGKNITIPAVLINKADGKKLEEFYVANKNNKKLLNRIVLEIDFEMEHPNNTVKYDFYFSSDNEAVYTLMQEFYPYHRELSDFANLTVHYISYQNPLYDERTIGQMPNCYGSGKYCNTPGKFKTNDGRVIIYENLKQKCIFNYAYKESNNKNIYWEYMSSFYKKCLNISEPSFNAECSAMASLEVGLPNDIINKCIGNSFVPDERIYDKENLNLYALNFLLEEDNKSRRDFYISFLPAIYVNGRNFMGSWRADNLFEAICAGYKKKPEVCYIEGAFKRESGLGGFSIFLIVVLIIAINALIFYFCRNYIKRKIIERIESTDINHKINTVVTSYLALRDNK